MDNKSAGYKQRLAKEAKISALIAILCAAAFLVSVRSVALFGVAVPWLWGIGFFAGLFASAIIPFCYFESAAATLTGAICYVLISGIGFLALRVAQ